MKMANKLLKRCSVSGRFRPANLNISEVAFRLFLVENENPSWPALEGLRVWGAALATRGARLAESL